MGALPPIEILSWKIETSALMCCALGSTKPLYPDVSQELIITFYYVDIEAVEVNSFESALQAAKKRLQLKRQQSQV